MSCWMFSSHVLLQLYYGKRRVVGYIISCWMFSSYVFLQLYYGERRVVGYCMSCRIFTSYVLLQLFYRERRVVGYFILCWMFSSYVHLQLNYEKRRGLRKLQGGCGEFLFDRGGDDRCLFKAQNHLLPPGWRRCNYGQVQFDGVFVGWYLSVQR